MNRLIGDARDARPVYLPAPVQDWSRWKDLEGISSAPRFSPVNFSSSAVGSRTPADGRSVTRN